MVQYFRKALLVSFVSLYAAGCAGGALPGTPAMSGVPQKDAARDPITQHVSEGVAISPPLAGAYFGAWVNPEKGNQEAETEALEGQIGRRLALDMHFFQWNSITPKNLNFPAMTGDFTYGRVPVISWRCGDNLTTIAAQIDAQSGSDYANVVAAAQAVAALNKPVFIRFFWEFNEDLNAQGGDGDAPNCFTQGTSVAQKAAEFVSAWEAIVNVFTAQGATDVTWLWNPEGDPATLKQLPQIASFLPPAPYVNWIGVDTYDMGDQGFDAIVSPFYSAFSGTGLPMLVAETGENPSVPAPCTQAQFFDDATASISGLGLSLSQCASQNQAGGLTNFPDVKAFMYFDAASSDGDWTLTPGSSAFASFAGMATNLYFEPIGGLNMVRTHAATPRAGRAK